MKRILSIFFLCGLATFQSIAFSQTNTFPSSGNVGIGTTTPGDKLTISGGNIAYSNYNYLRTGSLFLQTANTSANNYVRALLSHNIYWDVTTTQWAVQSVTNPDFVAIRYESSGLIGIYNHPFDTTDLSSGYLSEATLQKYRRVAISNTGRVGIGTTITPINGLHIFADNNFSGGSLRFGHSTSTDGVWSYGNISAASTDGLRFSTFTHNTSSSQTDLFTVLSTGKVGINTIAPSTTLQVGNSASTNSFITLAGATTGNSYGINFSFNRPDSNIYAQTKIDFDTRASKGLQFNSQAAYGFSFNTIDNTGTFASNLVTITGSGNVLIAKSSQTNSSYKLDVAGSVRADKITVNTTGADFVFEHDYKLITLNQLEQFVKQNHHLPGIETAAAMQKDGVDVGSNQTKLLQKIEELTLYAIEQNKQNAEQSKLIAAQTELLLQLKKELDELKAGKK